MQLLFSLGFLLVLASTVYGQSKATAADEKAIRQATEALVTSWQNHDYSDMANYSTSDVDWVNVVGMWWKGLDAVQKAHQIYHQAMFKNTPLTTVSTNVRFITDDVAIVHTITKVGGYTSPGGHPLGNNENMGTLIFIKQGGKWLLTAGQTGPIDANAAAHDPINAASKR